MRKDSNRRMTKGELGRGGWERGRTWERDWGRGIGAGSERLLRMDDQGKLEAGTSGNGLEAKSQLLWGETVSSGSHRGIADFGSKGDGNLATKIL